MKPIHTIVAALLLAAQATPHAAEKTGQPQNRKGAPKPVKKKAAAGGTHDIETRKK